ncbi:uncharacterized protein LOC132550176 isoform X2 [Ylistrum balloti]|uniref:uncharacterized protein LOC132550176 isoform X2 n=1 Tax=Ylistrum balloti TaxID=509963 RepID=UPI002905CA04|nr:uncharacterized protein LOC132550176 isoform X2 [Ylistrum balloti]
MRSQIWDLSVLIVFILQKTNAYSSYSHLFEDGECSLFARFETSAGEVLNEYCYKCLHTSDHEYLQDCINPYCHDPKFVLKENGSLTYYNCRRGCGGQPLACDAPKSIDNLEWSCSEDKENKLLSRKFLPCQTCHAVCSPGYQLKQPVTISCVQKNLTHLSWNTTEVRTYCISIEKICGTPGIPGVTLEDCETYDELDPSTGQFSFYQDCTTRCHPGLHQVFSVNTSCGEDGNWNHLERLGKMCIDPSLGCELMNSTGSWNCTGTWFNSTHVSSGAFCQLDCGQLEDNGNAVLCNNTHLFRLHENLQYPFCYKYKGKKDRARENNGYSIYVAVTLISLMLLSVCKCNGWGKIVSIQRKCRLWMKNYSGECSKYAGVNPGPTAAGVNPGPTAAGVNPGPTAAGVNPGPTAAGVNPGPTAAGVNPGPTAAGVNPGPTAAGVNLDPTAAGVNPGPTAASVNPGPAAAGVNPGPTAAGVNPGPTAAGVNPGPTAAGVNPGPTAAGVNPGLSPGVNPGLPTDGVDPDRLFPADNFDSFGSAELFDSTLDEKLLNSCEGDSLMNDANKLEDPLSSYDTSECSTRSSGDGLSQSLL